MGERSLERITDADLARLYELARNDLDDFFRRRPETGRLYRDRLLCIALCQGLPFIAWMDATGSRTSTSGASSPSTLSARSRIAETFPMTLGHPNSAAAMATQLGSPVGV